jgi:hypothetical protein
MHPSILRFLLYSSLVLIVGCSSNSVQDTTSTPANTSTNLAVFDLSDPSSPDIPLPNLLATADTTVDPLTNYVTSGTGKTVAKSGGARPANTPMDPLEALSYVNKYEMASTGAVSGLNAPIYIHFNSPVDSTTVTSSNIKVFQITPDSSATSATENNTLDFTDVSGMFTFNYSTGGTDLFLFPNFPLLPASRYLYVVTSRVKDAATGKSVGASFYFNALKSKFELLGPLAQLEAVRANVYTDSTKTSVQLSGYAKVMDDLITKSSKTTISSRDDIALMGRFITTGAGFISSDGTGSTASMMPVESALRAFAGGANLASLGGLSGKTWDNTIANSTTLTADAYWTALGKATASHANVASVVTGTIASADLSIDPVVARANTASINLDSATGAYTPVAGVVQPYRDATTHHLTGFYHTTRSVPFVLINPKTPINKVVIFQHGITRQKEDVIAIADALTTKGYTVVAIDLPLHGALAISGHTTGDVWGADLMAVGYPLATRSNIQQAAFNLHRLELVMRTGGFASKAGAAGAGLTADIKFVGQSLGSIVGAYYLAGNTTLATTGYPYTQTTLNSDMKGFLSVPGGRLAYLMQNSSTFGPSVNAGLAAAGIKSGTVKYNQFFQLTQSVIDPVDPATMTTPLATGLPSRLSGRIAIQEAVGDSVIPNDNTRYLGNALGGREVLGTAGAAVAPGFKQLGYRGGAAPRIPSSFMYTLTGGVPASKVDFAAQGSTGAATPSEGYFQFDQTGVSHGFLLDPTLSPTSTAYGQSQMVQYLLYGGIVDPTSTGTAKSVAGTQIPAMNFDFHLPPVLKIFGY